MLTNHGGSPGIDCRTDWYMAVANGAMPAKKSIADTTRLRRFPIFSRSIMTASMNRIRPDTKYINDINCSKFKTIMPRL